MSWKPLFLTLTLTPVACMITTDDSADIGDDAENDNGEDDDDGADDEDDDSEQLFEVAGAARRTASELGADNDGIGVLHVAALAECDLGAELLGAAGVAMADLSGDDDVDFAITDLPATTVHLAAFLDDNLDADPQAPTPGPGDLVFADGVGDGVLSCVSIDLVSSVDDVVIELNAVVPG